LQRVSRQFYCYTVPKKIDSKDAEELMIKAGFQPKVIFESSRTPWKSVHIKCGKIVSPTYGDIKQGRRGCRHCSTRKLNPDYAISIMRAAGLEPKEPYISTITRWKSLHIRCGKIVSPKFASIQDGHSGCVACSTKDRIEQTRLNQPKLYSQSEANKVAKKADLKPLEPYLNTKTSWKCRCLICNNIVYPKLGLLKSRGQRNCSTCRKAKPSKGKYTGQEATKIFLSNNRKPLQPYINSKTPWKSQCKICGTIGSPTLTIIKVRGNNCKKCGSIRTADAKKMSQQQAQQIYKKSGMKLLETYKFVNSQSLKCQCLKCNRIVKRPLASVKRNKNGCGYCVGTMVEPKEAVAFMISSGYKPKVPYPGTDTPWETEHLVCGRICKPTYGTIKRGGGGCRNCAKYGFDTTKPSYLYLITHTEFGAHKVGIANEAKTNKSDRLHKFQNHGWDVYKKWNFTTGENLIQIEAGVFRVLRTTLGLPIFLAKEQMKYGGETETVNAELISLSEIRKIVTKVIKEIT
jgi:hypothetical protein